jgi:hypothetical protein
MRVGPWSEGKGRGRLGIAIVAVLLLASGCGSSDRDSSPREEVPAESASSRSPGESGDGEMDGRVQMEFLDAVATIPPYPIVTDLHLSSEVLGTAIDEMWERSVLPRERLGEVAARVDGEELTYRDLAVEAVTRFGRTHLEEFVRDWIVLSEMRGRGIEIDDAEVEEGILETLDTFVKVRRKDVYYTRFRATEAALSLTARVRKVLEKAFAADAGKPRFDPENDLLTMGAYMTVFFGRYDIRFLTEWGPDRLGDGAAAIVNGTPIPIEAALPFVLARLCDDQLDVSLGDLVNATLAKREFARNGVTIDPSVADLMVASRRATAAGPIPWEAIIESKGRVDPLRSESIGWIRRKFDVWVGLEEILGPIDEMEVVEYFRDQQVMIGRAAVKAARLETLTIEPGTCRRKNPEGRAIAKRKVDRAVEALRAGEDFSEAVMDYSEEPATRRYAEVIVGGEKERIAGAPRDTNIRDSSLPDEVAAAVFFAPVGEWIGPIRTERGFVVAMPLGAREPTAFPYESEPYQDLDGNGRYDEGEPFDDSPNPNGVWDVGRRRFAQNELLTDRAVAWIEGLREKAEIEIYRETR